MSASHPSEERPRLLLGLLVVAVFSAPLLLGLRYGGLDHSLVHLGIQCALRDSDGLFLDAALGGGSPLLAEAQSGVFYPITWLLWPISDPELAASMWTILHLGLAGWAGALLGARSGLSRNGALALGAAHVLSGTVLNLILHGAYISGAAWMPLVWAGALGTFRAVPLRRGPVELAAGLGLLLLAGELQGFAIAAALALAELVRARPPRRAVLLGALALGAGLMVGMMQWLPTFGLRDAIARSGGLSFENQTLWSLGMPEALGMVWPGVTQARFASGATLFQLWTGAVDVRVPWNPTPYVGLGVLALGMAAWRFRETRWWAFGATALLLMALGSHTPIYGLVQTLVPPVGLFRYPAKYVAPASLALLLGAFHMLRHRPADRLTLGWLCGVGALSGMGVVAAVLSSAELQALSDSFTFGVRTLDGVRPEPGPWLMHRGLQATLFVGVLLLVWKRAPRWAPWVLVADLVLAAPFHVEPLAPILDFDAPRTHLGTPNDTVLCTDPSFPSSRLDSPERDWGLAGVTLVQRMQLKSDLQQCDGPAVPHHYLSSATGPTVTLWHEHLSRQETMLPAATALACTHLATTTPVPGTPVPDETPAQIAPPVTRLDVALARPRVLASPMMHSSGDAAVEAAMTGSDPEAVLRHLDDPTRRTWKGILPKGSGEVEVERHAVDRITLKAGPTGVVVLSQPWWPGWQARVTDGDGGTRALPIYRAAGVRLAVHIDTPAEVTLTYAPPLLGAGLAVGGLGWLSVLILYWAPGRWRRREGSAVGTV